jgi:TPR repeat protein
MPQPSCGGIPIQNNMRFHLYRLFLFVFTLVLSSVCLYGADLQAGRRAYEQKDYASALKELSPLAQEGKTDAQVLLGKMYMLGQGVPKNTDLAVKWFRAAADQGNAESEFFLGAMYLLPGKDIAQGLRWLRLSAEQGTPDAQLLLGMAYLKGSDVPHDLVEADMWLHSAATRGDKFAPSQCERAERQMTPDQIAKARALAAAWKPGDSSKFQQPTERSD